MRIDKLEGKEQWDQWSWAVKYRAKADSKVLGEIMDQVENMTEKEMEAFNAKDYVKFADMSEAYNEKNGFGPKRQRTE